MAIDIDFDSAPAQGDIAGRIDRHARHLVQGIGHRAIGGLDVLVDLIDIAIGSLVFFTLDDNLGRAIIGRCGFDVLRTGARRRCVQ